MKFDRSKVQAKLDGTFTCLYGDVQRVVDIVKGVVAAKADGLPEWFNPLIEETGIASVRSKYQHFEQRDGEPHVRIFAHVTGPVRGLLTLWKQAPLTDEDLRVVPDDAYWMYARNLDLAALWQEVLRVTKEAAPEVGARVEAGEAALAGMFGFSIVRDLLPKFGDTWVLFDAPQQGGFLITGVVLVAETTDAAGLNAILSAVIARTNAALGGTENRVVSKELEYAGHRIHYVVVSALPVPVAPAWCIVGQRVIFGLYPQTVAAAIRRLDAAPATPAAKSILDNPEFRAARASLPGPAIGIGYADTRVLARLAYPLVLGLRTAFASWAEPAGAAIDFATMPPWPEERELVRVHVSTSIMDGDGVILASQGGDGRGPVMGSLANAGVLTGMILPSLAAARQQALRVASMSNMAAIGQGCRRWADEHGGQFPDSLEDLLVEGLITEKELRSPRDPTGGVSYIYIPGQNEKSDPGNVLAYERLYDDKGTNVLFVAGYVEYLSPEAAKQALAETYSRLGREAEMPASWAAADCRTNNGPHSNAPLIRRLPAVNAQLFPPEHSERNDYDQRGVNCPAQQRPARQIPLALDQRCRHQRRGGDQPQRDHYARRQDRTVRGDQKCPRRGRDDHLENAEKSQVGPVRDQRRRGEVAFGTAEQRLSVEAQHQGGDRRADK
jgi:hypothetical protein